MSDGRHAARIALLGNDMAVSFATAADGHGGTPISEAQAQSQLLLTNRGTADQLEALAIR